MLFFILCIFFAFFTSTRSATSTFVRSFDLGNSYFNKIKSVVNTPDGGYLFVSSAGSNYFGGQVGVYGKMDDMGNLEWVKEGSTTLMDMNCITLSNDETFAVIAGGRNSMAFLMAIELNGDLKWANTFQHSSPGNYFVDVISTSDDHFVAVGQFYSEGGIVKVDGSNGNLLASSLSTIATQFHRTVKQLPSGEYVVLGQDNHYPNMIAYKFDANLNLILSKEYQGIPIYDYAESMIIDTDGNMVFAGDIEDGSPGFLVPAIGKINPTDFSLIFWKRLDLTANEYGQGLGIVEVSDGYVVTTYRSDNAPQYVAKVSKDCSSFIWMAHIDNVFFSDIIVVGNSFVGVGSLITNNWDQADILIAKTEDLSFGGIGATVETPVTSLVFKDLYSAITEVDRTNSHTITTLTSAFSVQTVAVVPNTDISGSLTVTSNHVVEACPTELQTLLNDEVFDIYAQDFTYDVDNELVKYKLATSYHTIEGISIKLTGNTGNVEDKCYFTQSVQPTEWNTQIGYLIEFDKCGRLITMEMPISDFIACTGISDITTDYNRVISAVFETKLVTTKTVENEFSSYTIQYEQTAEEGRTWELTMGVDKDFDLDVSETKDYMHSMVASKKNVEDSGNHKVEVIYNVMHPAGGIHESNNYAIIGGVTHGSVTGVTGATIEYVSKVLDGSLTFYVWTFKLTVDADSCAGFEKDTFSFTLKATNSIEGTDEDIIINVAFGMEEICSETHSFGLTAIVEDVRDVIPADNIVRLDIPMKLKATFDADLDFASISLKKAYFTLRGSSDSIRTIIDGSVIQADGTKMETVVDPTSITGKNGVINFQFVFGGDNEVAGADTFYNDIVTASGEITLKQEYEITYTNVPIRREIKTVEIDIDDYFNLQKGMNLDVEAIEYGLENGFSSSSSMIVINFVILTILCVVMLF